MYHILLPVYNEAEAVARVIGKLDVLSAELGIPVQIVVVDDGSTDGSAEILDAYRDRENFHLLRHERNLGIDAVFRRGIEYVADHAGESDTLILMEADDTNDLGSLPAMVEAIEKGNDIVIASRFVRGGRLVGFPLWRSVPCVAVNWLLQLVFAVEKVTDYTIFFRGYSVRLLQKALDGYGQSLVESTGFVANAEILLKMSRFRPKIHEVPLVYQYDRKESRSKLKIFFTIRQYLRLVALHLSRRKMIPGP